MTHLPFVVGVVLGASVASAAAQPAACFNPRFTYRAQPAGYHDVVAENTIGTRQTRVHITTSCVDLHNADVITLGSGFGCLTKGDHVVATTLGRPREHCIVTNIAPEGSPPHS